MLTPETTIAQHDSTTTKFDLIGAPDCATRHEGRRFISERVRVECWQGRMYASVSGRAIRLDGELGKVERYCPYNLRDCSWFPSAPSWLVEALNAAGVTW